MLAGIRRSAVSPKSASALLVATRTRDWLAPLATEPAKATGVPIAPPSAAKKPTSCPPSTFCPLVHICSTTYCASGCVTSPA
jgi:hypothetical protein